MGCTADVRFWPRLGILALVSTVLDSQDQHHRQLAQPFCELILSDLSPAQPLDAAGKKKRKRRDSETTTAPSLSARVLAAAPLLPFFDPASSLPLLEALIGHLSQSELDANARTLLGAALNGVAALPASDAFIAFWSSQLLKLNSLVQDALLEAAARVMIKGAEAIMPVSGVKADVDPALWRTQAAGWTKALLASDPLRPAQSTTVAALAYRSAEARETFSAWLQQHSASTTVDVIKIARPLVALVQVAEARQETLTVPGAIVIRLAEQLLDAGSAVPADAVAAVGALSRHIPSALAPVKQIVLQRITGTAGISEHAALFPAVSAITSGGLELTAVLESAINSALEPLTRTFVEHGEDDAALQVFVGQLGASQLDHPGVSVRTDMHVLRPNDSSSSRSKRSALPQRQQARRFVDCHRDYPR